MIKIKARLFDTSEFLTTEKKIAAYLEEALSDGNPAFVVQALGIRFCAVAES